MKEMKITITKHDNGLIKVTELMTGISVAEKYRSLESLLSELYSKIYGFKVGDKIKGTEESDDMYYVTNSHYTGYVIDSPDFNGKMVISKNISDTNGFEVECKYFEKAELLNCRVVCISSPNETAVGRIFNVVDGIVETMPGYIKFNITPVYSIEELNSKITSHFIIIKE